MKYTILVTGANGQLGNEMRIIAQRSSDKYIFTDIRPAEGVDTVCLDMTDLAAVRKMVADYGVNIIINCAAYTDVDKAEEDAAFAAVLNAQAPDNLAKAVKEVDGLLIHISTDYVFGGTKNNTPCTEAQEPNPTGVYGLTKLHGEQAVAASGCDYIILRTAWLYSEFGKNFVKTMLNLTATRPHLKVVFDQCGTPTYAGDLAEVIFDLVENRKWPGKSGVYHYSNEGVCSWFDFAKKVAEMAGNTECDIQPCHSNEFPSKVVRPSYSVLDKTKIKETFGIKIPYWTDALAKCMNNMKSE